MRCWYPFCCEDDPPPVFYCHEACHSPLPSAMDIVIAGIVDQFGCAGGTPWNGTWNLPYVGEFEVSTFPSIWECRYFHNIANPSGFHVYDQFASFPNPQCQPAGAAWLRCDIGHNVSTGDRYIQVTLRQEAVGFGGDVENIFYRYSSPGASIDCGSLTGFNVPYQTFSAGLGNKAFDATSSTCTLNGVYP